MDKSIYMPMHNEACHSEGCHLGNKSVIKMHVHTPDTLNQSSNMCPTR